MSKLTTQLVWLHEDLTTGRQVRPVKMAEVLMKAYERIRRLEVDMEKEVQKSGGNLRLEEALADE